MDAKKLLTRNDRQLMASCFEGVPNLTRFFRKSKGDYTYVIAAKKFGGELRTRAVVAQNPKETWIDSTLDYAYLAGYRVDWREEGHLVPSSWDGAERFYPKSPEPLDGYLATSEWLRRFIPHLVLLDYSKDPDVGRICFDPMGFLKRALKDPWRAEMLCKAGLSKLVWNGNAMKMRADKLLPWLKRHRNDLARSETAQRIVECVRRGYESSEEINSAEERKAVANALEGRHLDGLVPYVDDIRKYLAKNPGVTIWSYCRYLSLCRDEGRDMEAEGTVFPRDFAEANAVCERRLAERQAAERARREAERALRDETKKEKREDPAAFEGKILAFAEKLGEAEKDGYELKPMRCIRDFVETGADLHNCVGSYSYDERMARRATYCLVVWKDGKRIECAEIDPKTGEIEQLYGDHNRPSEHHGEIKALVARYALERAERK